MNLKVLSSSSNATLLNLRKAPFYMDEADVAGFEEPREILIDWLVREEQSAQSSPWWQGKTTLTKKVFDNKVVEHFDNRVWITVSQSYNIEGLLRGMLEKFLQTKGR
ncbi:NB-ARC domain disease resistance protein [Medicago truncatula]|uniref:NB-ARC domain disease resistance protein n=1 Tax=Medicago truncatula TaxID=3880 RepID=A0A072ULI7_MEDTR|nr:NB-ARC domain disease resistance protein [Medicago truncatula]